MLNTVIPIRKKKKIRKQRQNIGGMSEQTCPHIFSCQI